jgi:hypothetical protein
MTIIINIIIIVVCLHIHARFECLYMIARIAMQRVSFGNWLMATVLRSITNASHFWPFYVFAD